MAASAAAVRLEHLVDDEGRRVDLRAVLTAREQAVLRHASLGQSLEETARAVGLGQETVRSHFKKAKAWHAQSQAYRGRSHARPLNCLGCSSEG
jgi:DNA-binding CsgD family transcriptional regulator